MRNWIHHSLMQVLVLVSGFCLLVRGIYFHQQYALAHWEAQFGGRVIPEVFFDRAGASMTWLLLLCLVCLVATIRTRRLSWLVCFAGCLLFTVMGAHMTGTRY